MKYFRAGLIFAAVAWLATLAGLAFWYLAPSDNALGLSTSASANEERHASRSIGKGRQIILVEVTRAYKATGVKFSREVADGTEFAPVPFLNRELERQGAKWRVRSTDGLDAKIYEIS